MDKMTASNHEIMAERPRQEKRVLLLAPTQRDARLSAAVLTEAGLAGTGCAGLEELCHELAQGAGCLLIAESVLLTEGVARLAEALRLQPAWSGLPVIVLTRGGATESPLLLSIMESLSNLTLLEMPVRISTLLSTLRTALLARARQYQLRDQLVAQQEDKEALRESEERLRLALASGQMGLWEWDLQTGNSFWSAHEYELLGLPPGEGYEPPELFFQHVYPDDAPEFERALAEHLAGRGKSEHEFRIVRADGQVRWLAGKARLFFDASGQPERMIGVNYDITDHKLAELAINRAIERLAEADRRKDEFLAMLAHELRNPLAPIRNAAQVLRLTAPQEAILQRQREIIDRQVTHMARLLDDLLDVSRITRGNMNLKMEPVKLSDVFARAVESANPLVEARRHTLTVSPPAEELRVDGDLDRLIQIVGNLLSNAAKYTEEGGRIWLESGREHTAHEGEAVVIRVRDNGMGIAPEMLPRVFDVFTQVERSLDRSQGGLGLGLTLVRNLVQMHGGSVEARSAGLDQGSEFIVRLPVLPEAQPSVPAKERALTHTATISRRILVVDDVADTANSLAELLSLSGHEVKTAYDGHGALLLAREFMPDVILMDIGLPGMNGFEVARQIHREPELKDVILVALTGYGQEEDRREAEQAGFDRLFTKPVDLGALQSVLE